MYGRNEYKDHYKEYKAGDYIYIICDVLDTVDRYMLKSHFDDQLYIDIDGFKEYIFDILPSRTMNKTQYRKWKLKNLLDGKKGTSFTP